MQVGELVFEGNVLKLISHGEGRVVPDGAGWEYQYFLKDHLGNVRVTFTAKPQTAATSTANFEAATNPAFLNYTAISTFDLVDHTDEAGTAYQKVQWMNGGVNGRVGLAKSLAVMPGDEVTAAAYGKYMNLGSTGNNTPLLAQLAAAFGVSAGSTGEQLKLYSSLSSYAGTIPGGDRAGDNEAAPKAFVTILFFNKNFDLVDAAWDQITTTGAQTSGSVKQPPHDLLSITAKAPEAGYAYIYISNEHPYFVDVYFDDVSVVHTPSPIVAVSDYFPYGLQYNAGEKTGGLEQKILYNSKELQDELSLNWYDYGARMYMADIGRWGVVDPLGEKFVRWSAYNYALNNPLRFVDPTGMEAETYQGADAQAFWKGHQDDRQTRRDAKDNIKSFVKSGEITRAEGREVWRKYNTLRKQHGQTENTKQQAQSIEIEVVTYVPVLESNTRGLYIEVGVEGAGQFTELNWVQTVRTNMDLDGNEMAMNPFNDPFDPDDDLPFYYTNYEIQFKRDLRGYDAMFSDTPQRTVPVTSTMATPIIWQAELSLVGKRDGKYYILSTISYGFQSRGGNITLYPVMSTAPSKFQNETVSSLNK